MKQVTYLDLLNALLVVVILVGLAIIMQPSGMENHKDFFMLFIAVGGVITVALAIFQATLSNKDSIWRQPVSKKVSTILINSVVIIWLCLVGLTAFVVLKNRSIAIETVAIVTISIFIALACGRYLQKRFSSNTLMGYGVSSIAALVLMLLLL